MYSERMLTRHVSRLSKHSEVGKRCSPPTKGARSGPVKTVIENTVIARPRVRLSNIYDRVNKS